jgi:hypothetical protein
MKHYGFWEANVSESSRAVAFSSCCIIYEKWDKYRRCYAVFVSLYLTHHLKTEVIALCNRHLDNKTFGNDDSKTAPFPPVLKILRHISVK